MSRNGKIDRLREVRAARKELSKIDAHNLAAAGSTVRLTIGGGSAPRFIEGSFGMMVAPEKHAAVAAAFDAALAEQERWLLFEARAEHAELGAFLRDEAEEVRWPCSEGCPGWGSFNDDGEIQKCDDCGRYRDDAEAAIAAANETGLAAIYEDGAFHLATIHEDLTLSYRCQPEKSTAGEVDR